MFKVRFAFRPARSRIPLADLTLGTGLPHATVRRPTLELVEARWSFNGGPSEAKCLLAPPEPGPAPAKP
ncbi:hypothetical protein GCM10022232_39830 [Streptomyces plumbiresistens]|uniref:Uncharacterized protein n=1 Tax=Streptomyces plumbiresistens TaxID=511811 RepID=A0ABP7RJL5_9ACTN